MTDISLDGLATAAPQPRRDIGLKRRYAAERRFRIYGVLAICTGLLFLAIMLGSIVSKGYTAFWQTTVSLPITFDEKIIDPGNKRATDPDVLIAANYPKLAEAALIAKLGIDPDDKAAVRKLKGFLSDGARAQLRKIVVADPSVIESQRSGPRQSGERPSKDEVAATTTARMMAPERNETQAAATGMLRPRPSMALMGAWIAMHAPAAMASSAQRKAAMVPVLEKRTKKNRARRNGRGRNRRRSIRPLRRRQP